MLDSEIFKTLLERKSLYGATNDKLYFLQDNKDLVSVNAIAVSKIGITVLTSRQEKAFEQLAQ